MTTAKSSQRMSSNVSSSWRARICLRSWTPSGLHSHKCLMRGERTNIKLFDRDTYASIFFGSSVGVHVVLRKDVDERRIEEITLPEVGPQAEGVSFKEDSHMRVSSSRRMSLKCNVRHEVPYPQGLRCTKIDFYFLNCA